MSCIYMIHSTNIFILFLDFVLDDREIYGVSCAAPRHATPRHATPRHATPRHACTVSTGAHDATSRLPPYTKLTTGHPIYL